MAPQTDAGASAPKKSCCGACTCTPPASAMTAPVATSAPLTQDMVWISGGDFLMGSDKFYREERPARPASVKGFWIDPHPVTNTQFLAFVEATGYVTTAERQPDPALYPDADPELLVPGSLVFIMPDGPVGLRDYRAWWAYVPGASWRHPTGPENSLSGLEDHPVVHITYEDAAAYAKWAGKALPSEAEWEYAARGGLENQTYPWGEEFMPEGKHMANTWQGRFPFENLAEDGFERTSPVKFYPPNGYGLYDMAGNVWEWTLTPYEDSPVASEKKSCCLPTGEAAKTFRIVVKGGSHLCAPNYCFRYRPSARQGQALDTSTSHIGFRCIVRPVTN